MTVDTFFKWVRGQKVQYDSGSKVKSVDLIRFYLEKVYHIKTGAWGKAHCYFNNFDTITWRGYVAMNENFTKIESYPGIKLIKGDIAVWDECTKYPEGHMGIVKEKRGKGYFHTYEQGKTLAHSEVKPYKHRDSKDFLGVLRPKRTVNFGGAKIKNAPSKDAPVIGKLKAGTIVDIYDVVDKCWMKIGEDQWVFVQQLMPI